MAADDTIPKVAPMFWSFRLMVTLGIWFLFIFAAAFYLPRYPQPGGAAMAAAARVL